MSDEEGWVPREKYDNLKNDYFRIRGELKELQKFRADKNKHQRRIEELERKVTRYKNLSYDTLELLQDVVSRIRNGK